MELLSLIGILFGVALFLYMSFQRISLFFNAVIAALVIIVTSHLPIMSTIKGPYMTGLSNFLKGYLLLFVLSALFGKVMEDSGAVRRIAMTLASLTQKAKNRKYWVVMILPIFYFVLSYVGISGFVVVFTVVAIGRELFEQCDVPWIYYCYGSAGIYPAMILGGSLQPANIIVTEGFKVPLTAGFGLSVIMVAITWITLAVILKIHMNKTSKLQEGFLPSGDAIKKIQIAAPIPEAQLPRLSLAMVPLLAPVIAITIFNADVLVALCIATSLAFLIGYKNFKSAPETISLGVIAAIVPVVNVAAAAALAGIIKLTPAFTMFSRAIDGLPPMFSASAIILIMTSIVASSSSAIPPFLPYIVEKMNEAGVSPTIGARLAVGSSFTFMTPHNAGVVNAVSLTKLNYVRAASVYFTTTFVPGLASLVSAYILVWLGVFK